MIKSKQQYFHILYKSYFLSPGTYHRNKYFLLLCCLVPKSCVEVSGWQDVFHDVIFMILWLHSPSLWNMLTSAFLAIFFVYFLTEITNLSTLLNLRSGIWFLVSVTYLWPIYLFSIQVAVFFSLKIIT